MATATYEPIATTTLGSAAASITFNSIAATWTDLRLVITASVTGSGHPRMQYNGDTGANYSFTTLYGDGSSAGSGRTTANTELSFATDAAAITTAQPALLTADIFGYSGSSYKTSLHSSSNDRNGSGAVGREVGLWRSTSAITSVLIYMSANQFAAGTTATLYGIKAA